MIARVPLGHTGRPLFPLPMNERQLREPVCRSTGTGSRPVAIAFTHADVDHPFRTVMDHGDGTVYLLLLEHIDPSPS
jgi:hypothetical protein